MEGSADVETEKGRDGKWRVAGLCNNYLKHLRGSIQYKHPRYIYIWSRVCMASIPVDSVPRENRFGAIRFKQPTDSCLIRFLIIVVFRFLKILVDSIRFDSKRFDFFRFRTGSVPYVQRFRFLNRFGTILNDVLIVIWLHTNRLLLQIHEYFGSMDKSMLTLLIMGTILDDVTECSETCLQWL